MGWFQRNRFAVGTKLDFAFAESVDQHLQILDDRVTVFNGFMLKIFSDSELSICLPL